MSNGNDKITVERAIEIEKEANGGPLQSNLFYYAIWALFGLLGVHRLMFNKPIKTNSIYLAIGLISFALAYLTKIDAFILGVSALFVPMVILIMDGITLESWNTAAKIERKKALHQLEMSK